VVRSSSSRARARPSLKRELLFNFGLIVAAALSLAVVTGLIAQLVQPTYAVAVLVFLIVADVAIVFLFGRYLIERLIVRPMVRLTEAADLLAAGDLQHRVPEAETQEFTDLAYRFNHMTDRLLVAQRQLVRAEKMAGIGRLAAGIAHEIGNPLSAVGTYLDVLTRKGANAEIIAQIRLETERIDRIVRGLLAYARPQVEDVGGVDVGSVLRSAVELLTRQGTLIDVALSLEIEPDLPPVRGKTHLLEQVVVNLLLNAADAAPGGRAAVGAALWHYQVRPVAERRRSDTSASGAIGGGSSVRSVDASIRPWRPELADGTPGVLLWVADSGAGVPEADRERVFDPFFTTKEPGRGTGLGLAVAQRSVHDFGGVLWVDRAREGGAVFKVFLPADPTGDVVG
jgi:signal transduction histidine kinase